MGVGKKKSGGSKQLTSPYPTRSATTLRLRASPDVQLDLCAIFGDLDCEGIYESSRTIIEPSNVYNGLDRDKPEIRLLHILPGGLDDQIACSIASCSLEAKPVYTALSYTWGSVSPDCTIRVNGTEVGVTKNLWRFLSQMRSPPDHRQRKFWIDALCINQIDQLERTRQVGMIADIYRNAYQVYIWLGPAYEQSDLAINLFSRKKEKLKDFWWKREAAAVRHLFERPYWTRLWVFQELALASDVVIWCGNKSVPAVRFGDFVLHALTTPSRARPREQQNNEYEPILKSPAVSMFEQVRDAQTKANRLGLFDQVIRSQKLQCSELRDRVYALLSVVENTTFTIFPDYLVPFPLLFANVLRNQHKVKTPSSLNEVEKQCNDLAMTFRIDTASAFMLGEHNAKALTSLSQPIHPMRPTYGKKKPSKSGAYFWWAAFYYLEEVQALCAGSKIVGFQD